VYIGRHVKYPLLLSNFNEIGFFRQTLEKYSNVKFHENPSSGSRVVPRGQTDGRTDKRTDNNEGNNRFSQFGERA